MEKKTLKTVKKAKITPKKSKNGLKTRKNAKNEAKAPKIKAKGTQKVNAVFILDKSGSMYVRAVPTIGGFNEYLHTLQNDKNAEYLFTLTLFDTDVKPLHTAKAVTEVPDLDSYTYQPGGNTALYDAIGLTIARMEETAGKDKVLVIILTDGQENSSTVYSQRQILDRIKAKEKEGNWTFVYLGCDKDSYLAGAAIGIAPGNNMKFNGMQVNATMSYLASSTRAYTKGVSGQSMNFSKLEKSDVVNSYADELAKNGTPTPSK